VQIVVGPLQIMMLVIPPRELAIAVPLGVALIGPAAITDPMLGAMIHRFTARRRENGSKMFSFGEHGEEATRWTAPKADGMASQSCICCGGGDEGTGSARAASGGDSTVFNEYMGWRSQAK
jgi:hypothetical protein